MAALVAVGLIGSQSGSRATPSGPTCDNRYQGACVPLEVEVEGFAGRDGEEAGALVEIDCADVDGQSFQVVEKDVHGLDADGDGLACEPEE
jgi:hypothetical protein